MSERNVAICGRRLFRKEPIASQLFDGKVIVGDRRPFACRE
jgi:hypothetical protein